MKNRPCPEKDLQTNKKLKIKSKMENTTLNQGHSLNNDQNAMRKKRQTETHKERGKTNRNAKRKRKDNQEHKKKEKRCT